MNVVNMCRHSVLSAGWVSLTRIRRYDIGKYFVVYNINWIVSFYLFKKYPISILTRSLYLSALANEPIFKAHWIKCAVKWWRTTAMFWFVHTSVHTIFVISIQSILNNNFWYFYHQNINIILINWLYS